MLKPTTFIKTIRILIIFVFGGMDQNGIPRVSQSYFQIPYIFVTRPGQDGSKKLSPPKEAAPSGPPPLLANIQAFGER
jgi:hypothetical protein